MFRLKLTRRGDEFNMGISIHLIGLRDLDGKFQDMVTLKHLCDKNCIAYPKELDDYFRGQTYESEKYLREVLETVPLNKREFRSDNGEGFEIDVKDIPEEVKTLRFYMSC